MSRGNTPNNLNFSDLTDRFRKIRLDLGLTQQEMADKVGKSLQSVLRYEKGRAKIPVSVLLKIGSFGRGYNPNWLLRGEGPIYRDEEPAGGVRDSDDVAAARSVRAAAVPGQSGYVNQLLDKLIALGSERDRLADDLNAFTRTLGPIAGDAAFLEAWAELSEEDRRKIRDEVVALAMLERQRSREDRAEADAPKAGPGQSRPGAARRAPGPKRGQSG